MSRAKNIDIQNLSPAERILLAEALWDSIASQQDQLEVTEAQKKVLDARLAAYRVAPDAGTDWAAVQDEMK